MDKSRQNDPEIRQIDAKRRRLTKAGLAVPAVLGTLASRPVLAAVPWKCTVSGHTSGNVSGHESETCTSLGVGQAAWAQVYATGPATSPSPNPNTETKIKDVFPDLTTDYFFFESVLTTDSSKPVASIYQILTYTAPASLVYAQKALVLLLNANDNTDTTLYPLVELQAKNLFIAAATGANFVDTNPNITWPPEKYKAYIDLLWRA
jgi:hypothetical protein